LRRLERVVAQDINEGGYDVLFAHPCQFEKCPSVAQFASIPTVYYCQEPLRALYEEAPYRPYDGLESSKRKLLNKVDPLPKLYYAELKKVDYKNTRSARKVLANSKFMKNAIAQIYGVNAEVSYHGMDADHFRPLNLPRERFVFSVGSLTPMKGFDLLVQAVAEIAAEKRPSLIIASNFQNPPEKTYLEQMAAALDVDLHLKENVSEDELVTLYNRAAVVAYSPHREPFGLVPLEAMACAAPVVAVREGGVMETVFPGENGLLADRHPQAFAQALSQILDNPALAAKYGHNGRQTVKQQWTWDTAVAKIEKHLLQTANLVQPELHLGVSQTNFAG
jgi:glycosyltransferase involved in cell wall biosynthesis